MWPMIFPWNPMIPNLYKLTHDYPEPPTVYSLLNSYVNYGKPESEKKKIVELAKYGRGMFFEDSYPLTDLLTREEFETQILNHFLMRRIGYETVTAFKIQLNVKLNSIMPVYNKMFEALNGWEIFNAGETITRTNTSTKTGTSSDSISTTSSSSNTFDNRYSNTPQNHLEDVRNGSYVSEYTYNTGSNSTTGSTTEQGSTSNTGNLNETITRTPGDKIKVYNEFVKQRTHIFDMIFNELEPLFYQLI